MSLLAAAAIAASLVLSRGKPEERTIPDGMNPADKSQPAEKSLDAIRAAGL